MCAQALQMHACTLQTQASALKTLARAYKTLARALQTLALALQILPHMLQMLACAHARDPNARLRARQNVPDIRPCIRPHARAPRRLPACTPDRLRPCTQTPVHVSSRVTRFSSSSLTLSSYLETRYNIPDLEELGILRFLCVCGVIRCVKFDLHAR
ncbi:hypothetical protein CDL15_Pgr008446 [Punica granatum]|uniref:Uncharacterized protein n=1 Tax=Punica granatum TaxID=22663 RepID=A0A218WMX0_PUNGR|nr:hypothetical protein CDL15_Pgr008446 [Punica granatum]